MANKFVQEAELAADQMALPIGLSLRLYEGRLEQDSELLTDKGLIAIDELPAKIAEYAKLLKQKEIEADQHIKEISAVSTIYAQGDKEANVPCNQYDVLGLSKHQARMHKISGNINFLNQVIEERTKEIAQLDDSIAFHETVTVLEAEKQRDAIPEDIRIEFEKIQNFWRLAKKIVTSSKKVNVVRELKIKKGDFGLTHFFDSIVGFRGHYGVLQRAGVMNGVISEEVLGLMNSHKKQHPSSLRIADYYDEESPSDATELEKYLNAWVLHQLVRKEITELKKERDELQGSEGRSVVEITDSFTGQNTNLNDLKATQEKLEQQLFEVNTAIEKIWVGAQTVRNAVSQLAEQSSAVGFFQSQLNGRLRTVEEYTRRMQALNVL